MKDIADTRKMRIKNYSTTEGDTGVAVRGCLRGGAVWLRGAQELALEATHCPRYGATRVMHPGLLVTVAREADTAV